MNIGVLGTGIVGQTIATALNNKGHNVCIGSRMQGNEKAMDWVKQTGKGAMEGNFEEAALFGEIVFICVNGAHAIDAVTSFDPESVTGKIVIDVTNPLDFTHGMPPRILQQFSNGTSLGEEVQRALPFAHVVKTLNTVNCNVMVDAKKVNGASHDLFICGNNPDAKNKVQHFLVDNFNWKAKHLIDLGSIEAARTMEAIVPFWVMLSQQLQTHLFNFKIVQ